MGNHDIIIASTLGQLCSQVSIWPSEVLKLQRQIYPNVGLASLTKNIYHNHGYRGFAAGFGSAALANVPKIVSQFYFYEMFRKKWEWHHVPASVTSGVISAIASTPLYNLTTRQVYGLRGGHTEHMSLMKYAYNGFRPALLKNCIDVYTTFLLYDMFGTMGGHPLITGGIATSISSLVTNPIDVVKTVLQVDYHNDHKKNMWNAARFIYSTYGFQSFYAGCAIRMLRSFPGGAVRYYVFAKAMDNLSACC